MFICLFWLNTVTYLHLFRTLLWLFYLCICALVSISEENKRGLAEIRNEGALASIPQKQKTSKAERRAIQEAQRAAKTAAKEAGNYHVSLTFV